MSRIGNFTLLSDLNTNQQVLSRYAHSQAQAQQYPQPTFSNQQQTEQTQQPQSQAQSQSQPQNVLNPQNSSSSGPSNTSAFMDSHAYNTQAFNQWDQEQNYKNRLASVRKLGNYQLEQSKPSSASCQLGQIIEQAYMTDLKDMPFTALDQPCCPTPANCAEDVQWRAQFKHCPTTSVNTPSMTCAMAPKGDRYFVADLNPLLYERGLMNAAEWNPYKHFDNRQMLAQFLWSDIRPSGKDPYSKRISNLNENFCIKQAKQGPPSYVTF